MAANEADIEARDALGQTPLLRAVSDGRLKATRLLLDLGANIEARDGLKVQTPRLRASRLARTLKPLCSDKAANA